MFSPPLPPDSPTLPALSAWVSPPIAAPHPRWLWRKVAHAFRWINPGAADDLDPGVAHRAMMACLACLADLPDLDTRALRQLLTHARSRAELWHLRPEVYRLLSLHHSQAEAERRLAALNPLFERR